MKCVFSWTALLVMSLFSVGCESDISSDESEGNTPATTIIPEGDADGISEADETADVADPTPGRTGGPGGAPPGISDEDAADPLIDADVE